MFKIKESTSAHQLAGYSQIKTVIFHQIYMKVNYFEKSL